MNYFLDTEFIETFTKTGGLLSRSRKMHTIDLISIGIACEDGRTYFAISNEYNYDSADQWVKENVIQPLYIKTVHGDARNHLTVSNFHKQFGKSNEKIKEEILEFTKCWRDQLFYRAQENTRFFGYYADYDWVLFCSLFGRMIDLPKGFPKFCNDLKQKLDDKVVQNLFSTPFWYRNGYSNIPLSVEDAIDKLKRHKNYPVKKEEHCAKADAVWNRSLFWFITKL